MSNLPLTNREWGRMVIDGLRNLGISRFFMSPGARSSPLIAALAECDDLSVTIHYDERGMSFAALGHAMATGFPTVCITTSGSAVANLLPACVEASHSGVPVIFVTADRPPELRGTGANQTILQPGIFGSFVRLVNDLPCPADFTASKETLVAALSEAVALSTGSNPGPVHLNIPIREPLLESNDAKTSGAIFPFKITYAEASRLPVSLDDFFASDSGVVVIGRLSSREQKGVTAIIDWAKRLGWPVFCDPLSGARLISGVVRHADWLLQRSDIPPPKRVLHFGGALVSKRIGKWLSACHGDDYIQVRDSPLPLDPWDQKPHVIRIDVLEFCSSIEPQPPSCNDWLSAWKAADASVASVLQDELGDKAELSEIEIARLAARSALERGHKVFLANSMPVRDFDASAEALASKSSYVFGNRGASGIDGNIATIAGIAMANDTPLLAIIGDLSALHDLNSLPLLLNLRVTLVIVNNHGGGIFRFLPLPVTAVNREKYWETPHHFGFANAAAQFGIEYHSPTSIPALKDLLSAPSERARILECVTNRGDNERLHKAIADHVRKLDLKWPL